LNTKGTKEAKSAVVVRCLLSGNKFSVAQRLRLRHAHKVRPYGIQKQTEISSWRYFAFLVFKNGSGSYPDEIKPF